MESHDEGHNEFAFESGKDVFFEFGIFRYFFSDENVFGDSFHCVPFDDSFFDVLLKLGLEDDAESSFSEFALDFEVFEADFLFGFGLDGNVLLDFLVNSFVSDFFDGGSCCLGFLLWFVYRLSNRTKVF